MTGPKIIFFILAASIVVFSLLSVLDRRILRAAIYLLFVLVALAGLFYMMNFQFLAAVQLILYAGGIVVMKRGTATVSAQELIQAIEHAEK